MADKEFDLGDILFEIESGKFTHGIDAIDSVRRLNNNQLAKALLFMVNQQIENPVHFEEYRGVVIVALLGVVISERLVPDSEKETKEMTEFLKIMRGNL